MLREHVVLWAAVAVARAAAAAGPRSGSTRPTRCRSRARRRLPDARSTSTSWTLAREDGLATSRATVIGTGFFAAAVGAAVARRCSSPGRATERASRFAPVVVLAARALLYSLSAGAGPDERYILYLAPLGAAAGDASAVAPARDLAGRPRRSRRCCWRRCCCASRGTRSRAPFALLRRAGRDVLLARGRACASATYLPGDAGDALDARRRSRSGWPGVALAAVAAGRGARAPGGTRRACIVAAVVAARPAAGELRAVASTSTAPAAGPRADLGERAFADTRRPARARRVAEFAEGVGLQPGVLPDLAGGPVLQPADRHGLHARRRTPSRCRRGTRWSPGVGYRRARPAAIESPAPLPDYVVVPTQFGDVAPARRGDPRAGVHRSRADPRRTAGDASLWRATGFAPGGTIPASGEAVIRFYGTGLPPGRIARGSRSRRRRSRARAGGWQAAGATVGPARSTRASAAEVSCRCRRLVQRGSVDVRVAGQQAQVLTAGVGAAC